MREQFLGFSHNQPLVQVILVLKIEIERSLGHPCPLGNIGDGGLAQALAGEELKGGVHQGFFFQQLVFIDAAHMDLSSGKTPLFSYCTV